MKTAAISGQPKGRRPRRVFLNILLGISILFVFLAVINAVFFRSADTFLFGYKPYIVASESMEPTIMKNSLVLIKKGGYSDTEEGDVIAFVSDSVGAATLHRVEETTTDGFVTRGDANRIPDEQLVSQTSFLGHEIWHTNLTADIYMLFKTSQGIFVIMLLFCLLGFLLILATTGTKKKSRQKKTETSVPY